MIFRIFLSFLLSRFERSNGIPLVLKDRDSQYLQQQVNHKNQHYHKDHRRQKGVRQNLTCEEPMLTAPAGSGYTATWANYSSLPTHTQTDQGAITQFRDKEEEIVGLRSPPSNDGLASVKCINRFPGKPRESVRSLMRRRRGRRCKTAGDEVGRTSRGITTRKRHLN